LHKENVLRLEYQDSEDQVAKETEGGVAANSVFVRQRSADPVSLGTAPRQAHAQKAGAEADDHHAISRRAATIRDCGRRQDSAPLEEGAPQDAKRPALRPQGTKGSLISLRDSVWHKRFLSRSPSANCESDDASERWNFREASVSAHPMELWRIMLCYARGRAQVDPFWDRAVETFHNRPGQEQSLQIHTILSSIMFGFGRTRKKRASHYSEEERRGMGLGQQLLLLVEVCMIHPNSRRRICWDIIGVLLLMHDLLMMPMGAFSHGTTGLGETYSDFLVFFDWSSVLFWTLDMFLSFLTGHLTNEGIIELEPMRAMRYYLHSWFPLDLFIVISDWVSIGFIDVGSTSGVLRLAKTITRGMRILRLLRFMKLNSTTMRDLLSMINSEYTLTLVGLLKSLLLMVILNHYLACAWFSLSYTLRDRYDTWTHEAFGEETVSMVWAYTTSLHWSLSQFTPASMEVTPRNEWERFFNIIVIIFALVIFSSFVSGITQAMTTIRHINSERDKRESQVRIFLSSHKISNKLASRVWRCVHSYNSAALGQRRIRRTDVQLLRLLPESVKASLDAEVFVPIISVHPLFREYLNIDAEAAGALCRNCVAEVNLRVGEEPFPDWSDVQEMLFVVEGMLRYHSSVAEEDRLERQVTVAKGEWACEPALWLADSGLDGPLVAGSNGCDIVKVSRIGLRELAEERTPFADFLGRYARLFVRRFNDALLQEVPDRELFNDPTLAEALTEKARRQSTQVRGLTANQLFRADEETSSG